MLPRFRIEIRFFNLQMCSGPVHFTRSHIPGLHWCRSCSTVHILYPGNADDERPTHRPPDHKRKCCCCCCLFSCTCYALELATLICCEVEILQGEFCRLVTKLFPKDGTIFASQFHVCCSPYPGERERERALTDSSSIAVFTLLPCCFFGFLSRKLWACRSGDFELTGETFLVV